MFIKNTLEWFVQYLVLLYLPPDQNSTCFDNWMKTSVYFPTSFSASKIAVIMELLSDSWQIRIHLATWSTQAGLFFLLLTRQKTSLGDNSPKNAHGAAAASWILTGAAVSVTLCASWVLTETLFLDRKHTPVPQTFLLSEVFILLTLKSLICKNSSMIDLHFLSISSSDSEGFSCAGAGGASGLAGGNKRKKTPLEKENQHHLTGTTLWKQKSPEQGVFPVPSSGGRVTSFLATLPPVRTPNISVNQHSWQWHRTQHLQSTPSTLNN